MTADSTVPPTLRTQELRVEYPIDGGTVAAVRDVSLGVAANECLGVVGESGSGKTQLFMAVMGLLPPKARIAGSVTFESEEILGLRPQALNRVRGSRLTMVFQDPMSSLTPHLKIGVQLAEVLVHHRGMSWRDAELAAHRALDRVRIPDPQRRLRQYPHELSGGMRQRVMIGMSLLCEPSLLIADEPTSALDVSVQARILELLSEVRAETGVSIVLISHDIAVVACLADRIAVMYAGRIVESAPTAQLVRGARHPYTALLLQCVSDLREARSARMPFIAGQAPGASEPEHGCAFAPRCPRSTQRCAAERPQLKLVGLAAQVACHHPLA
ncbi:MAG TPA: ABC transporter ATP-binding protein [Steroidobacteraceae bacterium]|jgi:oligopeptide transport system ATP-binding protein|nr:ABC transporter ATP-binding protein [Steroidobacteraceae bacterium]